VRALAPAAVVCASSPSSSPPASPPLSAHLLSGSPRFKTFYALFGWDGVNTVPAVSIVVCEEKWYCSGWLL